MKKLLVAIMTSIIAVGAITGIMAFGLDDDLKSLSVNPLKSSAVMMGHVVLTVTDENGQITAYRQTDNVVTNDGDDCISELIFALTSGNTCTSEALGLTTFNNIAIGVGDSSSATETSSALASYYTGGPNIGTNGSPTGFDTAVLSPATAFDGADTLITTVFRNVGATITEASIQMGTVTSGLASTLAIQSFGGLPLGPTDALTIAWTVTIDGN